MSSEMWFVCDGTDSFTALGCVTVLHVGLYLSWKNDLEKEVNHASVLLSSASNKARKSNMAMSKKVT